MEPLEQQPGFLPRQGFPGILEDDPYPVFGSVRRNAEPAVFRGVLPGVLDQVAEDLQQLVGIGLDRADVRRQ